MALGAPSTIEAPVEETVVGTATPWIVIVWNDPVNLQSYVVMVFQKLFGFFCCIYFHHTNFRTICLFFFIFFLYLINRLPLINSILL